MIALSLIASGIRVKFVRCGCGATLCTRLESMGLRLGVEFDVVSTSQTGPSILSVGNTRLALGHSIASKMMVELVHMERE